MSYAILSARRGHRLGDPLKDSKIKRKSPVVRVLLHTQVWQLEEGPEPLAPQDHAGHGHKARQHQLARGISSKAQCEGLGLWTHA